MTRPYWLVMSLSWSMRMDSCSLGMPRATQSSTKRSLASCLAALATEVRSFSISLPMRWVRLGSSCSNMRVSISCWAERWLK
ncbi:hypothetical protein D3C75_787380 [compost metagenome]